MLALKRADSGLYGLPGGKREPGEIPVHAAIRECFEETGYVIHPGFEYRGTISGRGVNCYLGAIVARGQPLTPDEGEVVWIDPILLVKRSPWPTYNKAAFEHFSISYRSRSE